MGRRLKISENQAYLIQDVMGEVEGETSRIGSMAADYEKLTITLNDRITKLNGMYNLLTVNSIGEAMDEDGGKYSALKDEIEKAYDQSNYLVNDFDEKYDDTSDEAREMYMKLNRLASVIKDKVNILEYIIDFYLTLIKFSSGEDAINSYSSANKWSDVFSDNKNIDIS